MASDVKIGYQKLSYDVNRKADKISGLWSSKIDKYDYLTGEQILFVNHRIILE